MTEQVPERELAKPPTAEQANLSHENRTFPAEPPEAVDK